MSGFRSCAFVGTVVHKRLAPRRHAFSYRVFSLCLDVDEIDHLDRELRLFSRGRPNLLSFHDCDVAAGDGEPVGDHARRLLAVAGLSRSAERIELVTYPRLLGYAFNPLSVYFCRDAADRVGATIYEVTNTFGERKSYVLPVEQGAADGIIAQGCAKDLYVSPFTARDGHYGFHVLAPAARVVVGVDFRDQSGPILKTHFSGRRVALSDRAIAALVATHPLMTLKVTTAIHWQALRLWMKGVPLVTRHVSPRYSASTPAALSRDTPHV